MSGSSNAAGGGSNRPLLTQFRQQRLPAWQPVMEPNYVAGCLIIVAIIFIPIGAAVMGANNSIVESEVRYDQVRRCTANNNEDVFTFNASGAVSRQGCSVQLRFTVAEEMAPPVYMYYKLTSFYQNHRRYAKSRSDLQLVGEAVTRAQLKEDSHPLEGPGELDGSSGTPLVVNNVSMTYDSMAYSPAGLIAWSMFNDSFALYRVTSPTAMTLICNTSAFDRQTNEPTAPYENYCHKKGIAWDSDVDVKFKHPAQTETTWTARMNGTAMTTDDPYLANGWYANEPGHAIPHSTDEDLMVWMRTASLPTFRKLFRVIDVALPKGEYVVVITELYDTTSFDGEKWFVLSTTSWVGGKNKFLAGGYLAVGIICAVAGPAFIVLFRFYGTRKQQAIDSLQSAR